MQRALLAKPRVRQHCRAAPNIFKQLTFKAALALLPMSAI